MNRRGFSLLELVTVLSIMAVFTPIAWHFVARAEDERAIAQFHLRVADDVRTVAEQVRMDRRGPALAEPYAWRVGDCDVRYIVTDGVLTRVSSCDGTIGLARGVERFELVAGGYELVFALPLRPDRVERTAFFIGVPP